MKIKTKLYLNILVSAILIVLFLVTRLIFFNAISQESSRVKIAAEVKTVVFDLNILLNDYLLNRSERALAQWELRYNSGFAILQKAEEVEQGERELVKTLADDYLLFSRSFKQVVENYNYKQKLIKDEASPQELALLENQDARTISQLSTQSQSVISSTNTLEKRALARLDEVYTLTRNSAYGFTILLLVITIAVSVKISRDIAKSLTKLYKGTEVIGAGDLEYKIDIKTKDEIGQTARAFNEMTAKLKESYSGLEEKVAERTKQVDEKVKTLEDTKRATLNILEDLKEAKAKDEAILSSIGDGLVATDKEGRVILVNKVAENLLGFTSAEILGKIFIHVISMQDEEGNLIPDKLRPITLALSSGKSTTTTTTTYYYVRRDGIKFPVAIIVTPVIIDSKTIGAILVFRDITKEKEVDKAKTEFVSLASHQLRTPLSTINWYLEMLMSEDKAKLNDDQKEYAREAALASKRLVVLVNVLLNVSRIEMGTFTVIPESISIAGIIKSCVKEFEHKILEKKLEVSQVYDPAVPNITADPKLLDIVCQNLLENAINYTPSGGKIKVSLDARGSDILITVEDSGIGIPKNQQKDIFTKLFRADIARETGVNGNGLGLYMTKAIIDHSGGKIWFESPTFVEKTSAGKEEGKGTTFYITIPISGMKAKEGTKSLT